MVESRLKSYGEECQCLGLQRSVHLFICPHSMYHGLAAQTCGLHLGHPLILRWEGGVHGREGPYFSVVEYFFTLCEYMSP